MNRFADGYLANHIKQNPRYFIRHDNEIPIQHVHAS